MTKKIQITEKQAQQFNRMLAMLKRISKQYQTPDRMKKDSDKDWGLDYTGALEMAYENIQGDAGAACKGIKQIML
jgi:hypothetical protein